jgi:hypothetical protein
LNDEQQVDRINESLINSLISKTDEDLIAHLNPSSPSRWLLERIVLADQFPYREKVISIFELICENDKATSTGNSIIEILKLRTTAALEIARGEKIMSSSIDDTTKCLSASLRSLYHEVSGGDSAFDVFFRCPY